MNPSTSAPFASFLRVLCVLLLPFACAAQAPAPDTIFLHGNILTGTHLNPNDPDPTPARVQALAIRNGFITAVGDDAQILALKGPQTKIVDLQNRFAMPGFNDAHTHIAMAGQQRLAANLDGATSLADMQSRIAAYAKTLNPSDKSQWIVGGGWDQTKWPAHTLPTSQDIDAVTGNHPALLERVDGHIAVANMLALQAAHIDDTTPNPPGGHIDRNAQGHATGILREASALALVQQHIPPPTFGAFDRFAALGIIASMQPSHLLDDMAWASARLGQERSKYAYAWRSFLDHGVTLAFGTDYPVEPLNPFRGLYAAITRMNVAGTATFDPPTAAQEKLTLNEALYAYTQASAFAEFREHLKGRLEPGYLADLIVLDHDITKSTPQKLLHTKVLRTVVGGQIRYTAP